MSSARAAVVSCLALACVACGDGTLELFPSSDSGSPADAAVSADTGHDASTTADHATPSGGDAAPIGGCTSDADCTSSDAPRCEPTRHVCVQCIGLPGDCPTPPETQCNRVTNTCAQPCTTSADCSSPDVCDTAQGACADCLTDPQCSGDTPRCVDEECVDCVVNQDCPSPQRCWQLTCVDCVTNADCPDASACSTDHTCQ
jgi:hypothetical protein